MTGYWWPGEESPPYCSDVVGTPAPRVKGQRVSGPEEDPTDPILKMEEGLLFRDGPAPHGRCRFVISISWQAPDAQSGGSVTKYELGNLADQKRAPKRVGWGGGGGKLIRMMR